MCKFEKIDELELLSIDGGRGSTNWFYEFGVGIGTATEAVVNYTNNFSDNFNYFKPGATVKGHPAYQGNLWD